MVERIVLSPAAITWLGSAFSEKTKISPFTTIQVQGFAEEEKAGLVEQGVIDGESALAPDSYAIFETLAGADAYAGFHLTGAFGQIAKTAYFKGEKVVTVDIAGQEIIISTKVDADTMIGILNEITGISRLVNAQVNVKMGVKSALAFATLLDVTRKYALSQYAGLGELPVGYTADQLLAMFNQAEGSRWLTTYIKTLRLPQVVLQADELAEAMAGLLEAGLAEKGVYGYRLLGEAYDLATNFLIIEHVLQVRCGQETNGKLVTGEAMFLQAGLHDVLMLDVDAETVEFNTVSTYTMMEYLQSMMLKAPDFR